MKIVTWNIAGGRKINSNKLFEYGNEDLHYFSKQIYPINPDVICLQESHTNKTTSVASILAKTLNMNYVYDSPASPSHIDNKYFLGTSIISRHSFSSTQTLTLPVPKFDLHFPDGQKVMVHQKNVQLVKYRKFFLANIQLLGLFEHSYNKGVAVFYTKEIEKILLKLEEPIIFCGDFNVNKPQRIFKSLFRILNLKDSLPNKITRPNVKNVKLTPDHIYYSPPFKCVNSEIIKTTTDHYLCWAEFTNVVF